MSASNDWETRAGIDLRWHLARNLRHMRKDVARWTQQELADAMNEMGQDWKQVTVADAERASRPIYVDELVALAALFGVPVARLLLPQEQELDVGDPVAVVGLDTLRELIVGEGGALGEGGPDWQAARSIAGADEDDYRPANDYWEGLDDE